MSITFYSEEFLYSFSHFRQFCAENQEKQSDNEWKRGIYHNSQGFHEESITEAKGSVLNFQIYINGPMEIELWRLYLCEPPNLYKLLSFSKIYCSIMADKIGNKNIAEKSTKITIKPPRSTIVY